MKKLRSLVSRLKIDFLFLVPLLLGYTIILVILFALAYLNNKVIEFISLLITYFLTRNVYPITFHCKTHINCILATIVIFFISILLCADKNLTILTSIIYGNCISFSLYVIKSLLNYYEHDYKKRLFYENCKLLNIKDVEKYYDILYSSKSDKELADEFFVEPETIKQNRWRIKKKFKDKNIEL